VPNWPPYCFIENEHTVGIPTVPLPKELLGNNLASMSGLAVPGWSLENILPTLADKACNFVSSHAKAGQPFFLYLPLTSPHTPLAPSKEWQGKSGLGRYADLVMETDEVVGQVLAALDKSGVADNTLVLLASDNGCAPYVGVTDEKKGGMEKYKELEAKGHYSSYLFRGHKSDIWEGGHRIPFLVRWPGKVQAGSTSDQLFSLVDFMATCADILQAKIPANAGEDSVSLLPVLLGKATTPVHEAVVFHSINGSFAIQQGNWKLELCAGSGGWGQPASKTATAEGLPPVQLYDMSKDIGEQTNEYNQHPEIVAQLTKLLEKYVADGRSTPGAPQTNDVTVEIWKKQIDHPAKAQKAKQKSESAGD
jgi:arylsulfatase A-like enzyme